MPWAAQRFLPKGQSYCNQHEWYREDKSYDGCYHCVATRTHVDGRSWEDD